MEGKGMVRNNDKELGQKEGRKRQPLGQNKRNSNKNFQKEKKEKDGIKEEVVIIRTRTMEEVKAVVCNHLFKDNTRRVQVIHEGPESPDQVVDFLFDKDVRIQLPEAEKERRVERLKNEYLIESVDSSKDQENKPEPPIKLKKLNGNKVLTEDELIGLLNKEEEEELPVSGSSMTDDEEQDESISTTDSVKKENMHLLPDDLMDDDVQPRQPVISESEDEPSSEATCDVVPMVQDDDMPVIVPSQSVEDLDDEDSFYSALDSESSLSVASGSSSSSISSCKSVVETKQEEFLLHLSSVETETEVPQSDSDDSMFSLFVRKIRRKRPPRTTPDSIICVTQDVSNRKEISLVENELLRRFSCSPCSVRLSGLDKEIPTSSKRTFKDNEGHTNTNDQTRSSHPDADEYQQSQSPHQSISRSSPENIEHDIKPVPVEEDQKIKKLKRKPMPEVEKRIQMMAAECVKEKPSLPLLQEEMKRTFTARYKYFEKIDYDVKKGLHKYPALKQYRIAQAELNLLRPVSSGSDRLTRLKEDLELELRRVESRKYKPGHRRHGMWERAMTRLLHRKDMSKAERQILRMISLVFHYVEGAVPKHLLLVKDQSISLPRKLDAAVSPVLVMYDDELEEVNAKNMWIYADGRQVLQVPNLYEGVLTVYALHYVFNVRYKDPLKPLFNEFDKLAGI